MKRGAKKRGNSGAGYGYDFHGAFGTKEKAVEKESSTPGSFIKMVPAPGGRGFRWAVMSPRTNPRPKRKKRARKNIHELIVLGLGNPKKKKLRGQEINPSSGPRTKGRRPLAKRRRNDAAGLARAGELYKGFHGKQPHEVLKMQRSAKAREDYAALGRLIAIGIDAEHFERLGWAEDRIVQHWDSLPHLKFPDEAMLAASPDGRQLYILGGQQDLDLGAFETDTSKDLVDLGKQRSWFIQRISRRILRRATSFTCSPKRAGHGRV